MTKPLTFALELAGGILLFLGILPPADPFKIVLGAVLFLVGAIGIRYRMKKLH